MKISALAAFTTLSALLLPTALFANNQPLEKIDWSMSFAQVKQNQQHAPDDEIPTRLTYESQLFDMEFHQEYLFDDKGQLVNILYYKGFSSDATDCVSEYNRVKAEVEKHYGKVDASTKTTKDLSNTAVEALCSHTSAGDYKLDSKWQNDNANISFVLDAWKGQAYIGLSYKPL
ncbi:hypothetical protein [Thalassotalea sp. ND16A]|uniref:hypothetical protein n=1 Tax=Thalassotalea sp. ND16A TaxID=1535422 RepID=UPI00051A1FC6|nr:hypothetical protein [Thalassotalea sp. ND16A]KGJ99173.1 hypothetical protein ND16A_3937 [Thalassotalea sp. ND16A]